MRTLPAVIILILLISAGCIDHTVDPPEKQYDTTVISPLVSGDLWIYEDSLLTSDGSLVREFWDTVRVGFDVDKNGEIWHYVSHNNNPKSTDLFTNRRDGYYFFSEIQDSALLTLKYPVQAGYSELVRWDSTLFSYPITVSGQINDVPSTNEMVQVGKDKLSCYHYRGILFTVQDNDTVYKKVFFESFLAPGIGLVRSIERFDESFDPRTGESIKNGSEVSNLRSYTLK